MVTRGQKYQQTEAIFVSSYGRPADSGMHLCFGQRYCFENCPQFTLVTIVKDFHIVWNMRFSQRRLSKVRPSGIYCCAFLYKFSPLPASSLLDLLWALKMAVIRSSETLADPDDRILNFYTTPSCEENQRIKTSCYLQDYCDSFFCNLCADLQNIPQHGSRMSHAVRPRSHTDFT